mgnify:CR=1 FL=1
MERKETEVTFLFEAVAARPPPRSVGLLAALVQSDALTPSRITNAGDHRTAGVRSICNEPETTHPRGSRRCRSRRWSAREAPQLHAVLDAVEVVRHVVVLRPGVGRDAWRSAGRPANTTWPSPRPRLTPIAAPATAPPAVATSRPRPLPTWCPSTPPRITAPMIAPGTFAPLRSSTTCSPLDPAALLGRAHDVTDRGHVRLIDAPRPADSGSRSWAAPAAAAFRTRGSRRVTRRDRGDRCCSSPST